MGESYEGRELLVGTRQQVLRKDRFRSLRSLTDVQVQVGVDNFRKKLVGYAKQYGLDGASDEICLVVADIRHQGRAKSPEIKVALAKSDPAASLLKIGDPEYRQRLTVLKREMGRLRDDKTLGNRRYDLAKRDFV